MSIQIQHRIVITLALIFTGVVPALAQDNADNMPLWMAEAMPRSITPRTPISSGNMQSAQVIANLTRRIQTLESQVALLQSASGPVTITPAPQPGGGGSANATAMEAKTMAAEARDIAQRAEQKADQALADAIDAKSTAQQALNAAQSP